MSSISIQNLVKRYGAVQVLNSLDIEIGDGEFVALVGPSGCGKSTLLRMIAGLETVSGGTISIGEQRVNDVLPKDRNVAMVFQNYALYPHMTVAQNIGFSLKMGRVARAEIDDRVRKAAGILELDALLDRYPRQLSGGQRQRVAMGRAIVRNPEAFLFDEPLSNLDAQLRVAMRAEIGNLHRRLGTTTVYVTHDQIEAMTMADRLVVLRGGNVEQIGTPLEIYDHPNNAFVAGFIGSPQMNFLQATVRRNGAVQVELGGGQQIGLDPRLPLRDGDRVTLGIRPEHLIPAAEGLPLLIDFVEPTGAESLIVGRLSGQKVTVAVRGRVTAQPGDMMAVRVEGPIHAFDIVSGVRLDD